MDYTNMPPQNVAYNYYAQPQKKNIVFYILLMVSIAVCIISCFLPYFEILGETQNYVLGPNDKILDGIFVLVFGGVSILLMCFKKKIPVLVLTALSFGVFLFDYIDQVNNGINSMGIKVYGIGFYLLFVFTIVSVVLSIIRLCSKRFL